MLLIYCIYSSGLMIDVDLFTLCAKKVFKLLETRNTMNLKRFNNMYMHNSVYYVQPMLSHSTTNIDHVDQ